MGIRTNNWLPDSVYKRNTWIRFLVGIGLLGFLGTEVAALDPTIAPTADMGGDWGATNRRWRAVHVATNRYGTNQLYATGAAIMWNGTNLAAAGSGDMLKATYDTDANDLVEQAEAVRLLVRNNSGSGLVLSNVVYVTGWLTDNPTVALADNDDSAKMPAFGIVTETINNGATGRILVYGALGGLDTSGWSVGDPLYISSTAGILTSGRPSGRTEAVQKIAEVTRSHATLGSIIVIGAGRTNDESNDIPLVRLEQDGATATQVLAWDNGAGTWGPTNAGAGSVGTDDVGTDELDDDANTPVAGYAVVVETGAISFDYSDLSTVYRGATADHTHQSTGAQAGQVDHGLANTGLTDDDHTIYRLESADHTHATTGLQGGTIAHSVITSPEVGDDHTQYRLESADHTHQSTGAAAGTIDHGLATTGLTDDDHTQYRLESVDHSHATAGAEAGKIDHGAALNGLADDDHTEYISADNASEISGIANKVTPVAADFLVIEDSEAANVKKHITISQLPAGSPAADSIGTSELDDAANTPVAGYHVIVETGALDFDYIDHDGAADPHAGYRLESADHTHQSTGAQAGTIDHGLATTGLTDDDHTIYRLESADHTHATTGLQAGKLDHGNALDGLTDDDHTEYISVDNASEISGVANKAAPVAADFIIIEDSEAANVKKHITISQLPAGSPAADSIGTSELDDAANTPVAGYAVIVETGALDFDYLDLSIYGLAAGEVWSGDQDFTAAAPFTLANGATPTIAAVGDIGIDTTIGYGGGNIFALGYYDSVAVEVRYLVGFASSDSPQNGEFMTWNDTIDGPAWGPYSGNPNHLDLTDSGSPISGLAAITLAAGDAFVVDDITVLQAQKSLTAAALTTWVESDIDLALLTTTITLAELVTLTSDVTWYTTDGDTFTGDVTGTIDVDGSTALTIADTVTVTDWTMGASAGTTPTTGDNDTSLATTLFVQREQEFERTGTWDTGNTGNLSPTWVGDTEVVLQNPGAADVITLPAVASYDGKGIIIMATTATNDLEVDVTDGAIIWGGTKQTDGVTITVAAGAGNFVSLICDGNDWIVIGSEGTVATGT